MDASALARKLFLKPGHRALVLNAPEGALDALAPLPDGVSIETDAEGAYDLVLLFARDQAALAASARQAVCSLEPGGLLWVAYPKGSSRLQTDLTRDRGWEPLTEAGYVGVGICSWDDTWSCFRLRPKAEVGSR